MFIISNTLLAYLIHGPGRLVWTHFCLQILKLQLGDQRVSASSVLPIIPAFIKSNEL